MGSKIWVLGATSLFAVAKLDFHLPWELLGEVLMIVGSIMMLIGV